MFMLYRHEQQVTKKVHAGGPHYCEIRMNQELIFFFFTNPRHQTQQVNHTEVFISAREVARGREKVKAEQKGK